LAQQSFPLTSWITMTHQLLLPLLLLHLKAIHQHALQHQMAWMLKVASC
jgi:hypothetical protein